MRRVLAVFAMAAIGGYAEAGFDSATPDNPILSGIQTFIAQQRQSDVQACAALGKIDIEACVRDRIKQRRAELEGPPADPATPAGTEI